MSAERSRRAVVTEADGQKAAAITVAEGNKRPHPQRGGKQAGGDPHGRGRAAGRDPARRGFALALQIINEQAATADMKTMSLQYLETLKSVGASRVEDRRADGALGAHRGRRRPRAT